MPKGAGGLLIDARGMRSRAATIGVREQWTRWTEHERKWNWPMPDGAAGSASSRPPRRAGVGKMIRHYEQVGLLGKARRTTAGYRIYDETDVQTLRFVRRARDLGFSIKEISDLLALWQDKERPGADVSKMVQQHVSALDARIGELQAIRRSLQHLADKVQADDRPDHPVLEELAEAVAPEAATAARLGSAAAIG